MTKCVETEQNKGTTIYEYQYDKDGNLISESTGKKDITTYEYTAENRLKAISTNINTGFQYLRARYYNTENGNFVTEDTVTGTLTEPLTRNRYGYVSNNLLNYADPTGHFLKSLWNGASKLVNGAIGFAKDIGKTIGNGINNLIGKATNPSKNTQKQKKIVQGVVPTESDLIKTSTNNESSEGYTSFTSEVAQQTAQNRQKLTKDLCSNLKLGREIIENIWDITLQVKWENSKLKSLIDEIPKINIQYTGTIADTVQLGLGVVDIYIGLQMFLGGTIGTGASGGTATPVTVPLAEAGIAVVSVGVATAVNALGNMFDVQISKSEGSGNDSSSVEQETELPDYVKDNRVPQDKETVLGGKDYQKTGKKVKGAQVYKKDDKYYYRDTFHTGESAHLEVFDKRGGTI